MWAAVQSKDQHNWREGDPDPAVVQEDLRAWKVQIRSRLQDQGIETRHLSQRSADLEAEWANCENEIRVETLWPSQPESGPDRWRSTNAPRGTYQVFEPDGKQNLAAKEHNEEV